MSDEKLRSNEVIPGAERCPHDYGRSENGHFDECHTCCKRELARLRARVEWLTNRFEDVVEDADLLLKSAPEALHPAILGIRTVADNQLGERSFDAKQDGDLRCEECNAKGGPDGVLLSQFITSDRWRCYDQSACFRRQTSPIGADRSKATPIGLGSKVYLRARRVGEVIAINERDLDAFQVRWGPSNGSETYFEFNRSGDLEPVERGRPDASPDLVGELTDLVVWMSGSADFAPEGQAGQAWKEKGLPLLKRALDACRERASR